MHSANTNQSSYFMKELDWMHIAAATATFFFLVKELNFLFSIITTKRLDNRFQDLSPFFFLELNCFTFSLQLNKIDCFFISLNFFSKSYSIEFYMILPLDLLSLVGICKELSTFFLTESNTILAILSRFYTFILRSKTFVHYSKSKIHDSYFFQLGTLLFPPLDLCKKLLSCKRRACNEGKKWKKSAKKEKFQLQD